MGRSLGIFGRYGDGAGFWPTDHPLTGPVLALLLLLGLGYSAVRLRDPRAQSLALWAIVGMTGMVLTVETPNLQRMATALPALFLGAAVLLDDLLQRIVRLAQTPRQRRRLEWLAYPAVALVLVLPLAADLRFYFTDYAQMNRWEGWNQEGYALTLLPPDTLHVSMGDSFHMVNSGWVRLLAPDAARGGVRAPGSFLPLPEDGTRGLAFMLYPGQGAYLPWLLELYPTATPVDYRRADESHYFDLLYVPAQDVAASRGALVTSAGQSARVDQLGAAPPFTVAQDAPATWSATLRVPQQWNYSFRLEGAPAMLTLDGVPILARTADEENTAILLNLARGDHAIVLSGPAGGVTLTWARVLPMAEPQYAAISLAELTLSDGASQGWSGVVEVEGLPPQLRQENALATCCLGGQVDSRNRPLQAHWQAFLTAPQSGEYAFQITMPGAGALRVGEVTLAEVENPEGGTAEGTVTLPAGEHPVSVEFASPTGANGALELIWTPPGGAPSILPASALRPAGPLFGPPLGDDQLLLPDAWPTDTVLETVE